MCVVHVTHQTRGPLPVLSGGGGPGPHYNGPLVVKFRKTTQSAHHTRELKDKRQHSGEIYYKTNSHIIIKISSQRHKHAEVNREKERLPGVTPDLRSCRS